MDLVSENREINTRRRTTVTEGLGPTLPRGARSLHRDFGNPAALHGRGTTQKPDECPAQ